MAFAVAGSSPKPRGNRKRSPWGFWFCSWIFPSLLLGIVWVGNLLFVEQLPRLLELGAAQAGLPLKLARASWEAGGVLRLEDASLGKALHASRVRVGWRLWDLWTKKEIAFVELDHLVVRTQQVEELLAQASQARSPRPSGRPWRIRKLRIHRGLLEWQGLVPRLGTLLIAMGRSEILEMENVPLGQLFSGGLKLQWVSTGPLSLDSPLDPLSPILSVEDIRLRFSWEGLARHRIEEVELLGPTIFLGPDLFWFLDEAKKGNQGGKAVSWMLEKLRIQAGRFIVSAFGAPQVELPFTFESESEKVRLDRLHELSLRGRFVILPGELDYPKYGLHLSLGGGSVGFSLPAGAPEAKNVVQVVRVPRATWKGLVATDGWVTFTFDPKGIYGELGAKAYQGYMKGGFAIYFARGYPWLGWLNLSRLNGRLLSHALEPLSGVLEWEGSADGAILVQATGLEIQKTELSLSLPQGGRLRLKGLRRLAAHLPRQWAPAKRALVSSVLASLAEYPFRRAALLFRYGVPESRGHLDFWSDQGDRRFALQWFQDEKLGSLFLPQLEEPR
jgi:hypothetical protein